MNARVLCPFFFLPLNTSREPHRGAGRGGPMRWRCLVALPRARTPGVAVHLVSREPRVWPGLAGVMPGARGGVPGAAHCRSRSRSSSVWPAAGSVPVARGAAPRRATKSDLLPRCLKASNSRLRRHELRGSDRGEIMPLLHGGFALRGTHVGHGRMAAVMALARW